MLHPGIEATGAHRLVKRVLAGDCTEQLAIAGSKSLDGRGVEHEFADRFQQQDIHSLAASLRERIEPANGFDLIPKKIEPERLLRACGKEIEDASPDGILTRLIDDVGPAITVAGQEAGNAALVQPRTGPDFEHAAFER